MRWGFNIDFRGKRGLVYFQGRLRLVGKSLFIRLQKGEGSDLKCIYWGILLWFYPLPLELLLLAQSKYKTQNTLVFIPIFFSFFRTVVARARVCKEGASEQSKLKLGQADTAIRTLAIGETYMFLHLLFHGR